MTVSGRKLKRRADVGCGSAAETKTDTGSSRSRFGVLPEPSRRRRNTSELIGMLLSSSKDVPQTAIYYTSATSRTAFASMRNTFVKDLSVVMSVTDSDADVALIARLRRSSGVSDTKFSEVRAS